MVMTVSCQAGEILTGGGFDLLNPDTASPWRRILNQPKNATSWQCGQTGGPSGGTCYAICCTIE
jgi:hypothetical protein